MNRSWAKLPSPMQRTLADDLKWGVAVMVGGIAGYFLLDLDTSQLVSFAIGIALVILALNVVRRVRR